MSVASDFRAKLTTALQQALIDSTLVDDVFEIVPGMLEGPQSDKDRGSIWTETIEEHPDTAALELITAKLRVFKRRYVSRGADLKPFDPATLEAIGEFVQTSLNGTVMTTLGPYSARVENQEFLIAEQGIEITIVGTHGNLSLRTFA